MSKLGAPTYHREYTYELWTLNYNIDDVYVIARL